MKFLTFIIRLSLLVARRQRNKRRLARLRKNRHWDWVPEMRAILRQQLCLCKQIGDLLEYGDW